MKSTYLHRIASFTFTGCMAGFISCTAVAQPLSAQQVQHQIDQHFQPLIDQYQIPGMSVAVTMHGRHYYRHYGVASVQTQQAVSEQTLFELGSVSKLFTATLTGYTQAQGNLKLSDHPAQYFPELKQSAVNQATLLNLGTYTAGGFPLQFPEQVTSQSDMVKYFQQWQPKAAPDRIREYSNPSIGLMGELTARAMKAPYTTLMERNLLVALGMRRTYIQVPTAQMPHYAWGYKAKQAIRVSPGMFDAQAYGLKSTTADMLKFLDAELNPQRLKPALQQAVENTQIAYFKVGPMQQGLGWEQYAYPVALDTLLAGNSTQMALNAQPAQPIAHPVKAPAQTWLNKTGATNGFAAYVVFIPSEQIGLVMLANRNFPNEARIRAAYATLTQLIQSNHNK
ncbi:beta-lactamase [Acinetobacter sp. UGAL515B_02]|nr:class C beta-lactamase [Acinetobacter sp. UGAL515B_02]WON79754.1 beta-lactamase [Acinetobacter sp. UGAL515B_02]